jgi:hypothetical protein
MTALGVFALQKIEKGELLTLVPSKHILMAGADDVDEQLFCDSIQLLIDKTRNADSFFSPFVEYLLTIPQINILSNWTKEGRKVLKRTFSSRRTR